MKAMLFNTHAVLETSLESREYPLFLDIRSIGEIFKGVVSRETFFKTRPS
jgi:hypothetical protein